MSAPARAIVGEGDDPNTGQIPFTPRAKQALELALREALGLGHNYIGTEHVLLGVTRDDGGVAAEILRMLGTSPDSIRAAVIRALSGQPGIEVKGDTVTAYAGRPWPRQEEISQRGPFGRPVELLVTGWVLFALALGVGILIGWGIWHH